MIINENKIFAYLNNYQVFIHLNYQDSLLEISFISVQLKKGELILINKGTNIETFKELATDIPKNKPLNFIISGDGILSRINPKSEKETIQLIKEFYKSIDIKSVYFSRIAGESYDYISLIRQEKLHEIAELLQNNNLAPSSIHFGLNTINEIGPYLLSGDQIVETGGFEFVFSDNTLVELRKSGLNSESQNNLLSEDIESNFLIPYSFAIAKFKDASIEYDTDYSNNYLNLYQELLYAQFNRKLVLISIGILFVLLLANYLTFDYLNKQNSTIQNKIYTIERGRNDFNQKLKQSKEELQVLNNLGFNSNVPYTQIVDIVSNSLPHNMSLTNLSINPAIKSNNKTLNFETGKVSITGMNSDIEDVERYEEILKNLKWVQSTNINLVESKEKEKENKSYLFHIILYLKDEY